MSLNVSGKPKTSNLFSLDFVLKMLKQNIHFAFFFKTISIHKDSILKYGSNVISSAYLCLSSLILNLWQCLKNLQVVVRPSQVLHGKCKSKTCIARFSDQYEFMLNLVSIVPFNILSKVINAAYFTFISFVLISF